PSKGGEFKLQFTNLRFTILPHYSLITIHSWASHASPLLFTNHYSLLGEACLAQVNRKLKKRNA
ncbi:MAG: hypothetical protein FWG79_07225, partial [Bacteroidales bacterium]|nr:hypothetical protein [Bacteroidales bacterium]